MKKMFSARVIRGMLMAALGWASLAAQAFMPAGGLWIVDKENTGQPGRGFQIEVENEVVVLTYYGYRQDGSSVSYLGVGNIKDNVFTAALNEYKGGTTLGSPYKAGTESGSPGNVTIKFTSGLAGTITLPGEGPKEISKFSFGYPANPDGLLGTYVFTTIATFGSYSDHYTLTKKLESTPTGNGMVSNAARTFGCENVTSGLLIGQIMCVEANSLATDDYYFFRMSGDRGAGVGTWQSTSSYFPMHVLRIVTKSGQITALNDGTLASLEKLRSHDASAANASAFAQQNRDYAKNWEPANQSPESLSAEDKNALSQWAEHAKSIMRAQ